MWQRNLILHCITQNWQYAYCLHRGYSLLQGMNFYFVFFTYKKGIYRIIAVFLKEILLLPYRTAWKFFLFCVFESSHICVYVLLLHCTKGSSEKQIKSRPNLSFAIGNNRVWFLNLSIILYIHICVNPLYILSNAFLQCCGSSDFLYVDPDLIFRIGADPIFLTDTDSIF